MYMETLEKSARMRAGMPEYIVFLETRLPEICESAL
jgi:hypothetical protein